MTWRRWAAAPSTYEIAREALAAHGRPVQSASR